MGEKILKYYEFAQREGGIQAKMRLAIKTTLSSDRALFAPDSPEILDKFKVAVKEITGKEAPVF
ncbi:MAG: hypothetical protein HQM08_02445 [Candidatus Riflebacteria bacterium]|nr:hypothetical protein [Candidatus Riflebacteria bacterium]